MASICNANGKIVDGPNFTRVTNEIRNLTSFGFSVTLNNILHTSTSSENILQNIEYGCRLGVAGFSFTVPVCKSSCEEYESDYYISEPVVQQLIVMVKEIEHKMSPKLNIEFNYPDCNADSCPANSEIFGITSDGVVSTCLIKQYQMNCWKEFCIVFTLTLFSTKKCIDCTLSALYAFPQLDARRIYSTNVLKRLNRENRRRTSVVGIFSSADAYTRLVTTFLMEYAKDWPASRAYLREKSVQAMLQPVTWLFVFQELFLRT